MKKFLFALLLFASALAAQAQPTVVSTNKSFATYLRVARFSDGHVELQYDSLKNGTWRGLASLGYVLSHGGSGSSGTFDTVLVARPLFVDSIQIPATTGPWYKRINARLQNSTDTGLVTPLQGAHRDTAYNRSITAINVVSGVLQVTEQDGNILLVTLPAGGGGSLPAIGDGMALANVSGASAVPVGVHVPVELLATTTYSAVTQVEVDITNYSAYDYIEVQADNVIPSNQVSMFSQLSTTGSAYIATGYKYGNLQGNSIQAGSSPNDTKFLLCDFVNTIAAEPSSFIFRIRHPGSATMEPAVEAIGNFSYGSGSAMPIHLVGWITTAEVIKKVRFYMQSGTLSMTVKVTGYHQ